MKIILIYLLLFLFYQQAFGQVSGRITETSRQPVPFATVVLLKSADSSLVKSALTNEKGVFQFDGITEGKYELKISMVGYQTGYSPIFEVGNAQSIKDLGTVVIKEANKQLGGVVIKADKPFVQQEAGGLTVNVQNSILTKGSSVLDVLQRSPGVVLDQRTNGISLNGKTGVMIMIDGKLMRLSMEQITTLLNGMSADNIEKIELLNTPPAKYDADGNAGLINIVTKKNKKPGTNGSITASAGYGKYEKGSASLSLNHNTGKISLRGSYSYSHHRSYGELFANGTEDVSSIGGQTSFNYSGIGKPVSDYNQATAGIDAQLSQKTTIGYNINYSMGHDRNDSHNYGAYALKPDSVLLFNSMLHSINHSKNMINSFYLDKEFNKNEKLHVDMDYLYYKSDGQTMVQSSFVDNHGNEAGGSDSLYAPQQRDLSNTTIQVGVGKMDYTNQLNGSIKIEAGIKGTYTKTSALSGIENLENGQWVNSSVGTSNNLVTREAIGAAYATFNLQIDSLTNLIAGARYEYSHNSTDKTVDAAYIVDRKLGKLFPAIFFTHKLNDHSELQLSYTNRITRPSYSDLASYITYNDPVSVFTGNPTLKPTITHNLKLGYNYHSYLFSLLFSRDDNPILSTQIATGPTKGLVYLSPKNAAWQNNITLQTNIPIKINNWWEMRYDFTGGLRQYKVDYTPTAFEKTCFGYSINFTENFKLPHSFSIELSGYYNSTSYYGTSKTYANTIVNGGIRKELNNNKGSFQLSVSDIFSAAKYGSAIGMLTRDAFNSDVRVAYNAESVIRPIIKLTYYRSFGSSGNKDQQKRDSGAGEERSRL